jgi:holo-[acyl-carrier protein] synthase
MRLISHGIDLIECERIAHMMEQYPEQFLRRILTDAERQYVKTKRNPIPHIAGRFAAKEAILKVLGTGWRGQISWRDIEVTNDANGQPHVSLTGESAAVARRRGITQILLSISHTPNYATASALGIGEAAAGSEDA